MFLPETNGSEVSFIEQAGAIAETTGSPLLLDLSAQAPLPGPFCPDCGGPLRVLAIQLPFNRFHRQPLLANTG